MAQLQRLGFAELDARRALAAVRDSGAAGTPNMDTDWQYGAHTTPWGQRSVAAALDWLCVHLPEASLPAKYAAGELQSEKTLSSKKNLCKAVFLSPSLTRLAVRAPARGVTAGQIRRG